MSDYRESGVDRHAAANWVEGLRTRIQATYRPEILSPLGGYGALFQAPSSYAEPVWVASTDGVGTKLLLAEKAGDEAFFAMGIDVVAMCVNDLLACRAEPFIFLDYLALDRIQENRMNRLLSGIVEACRQSSCSLVGGETAEMPGFYPSGRLDVAGFSLGVLDRSQIFNPEQIPSSLRLIGFKSKGFHSNGFSLIRKVMEREAWELDSEIEGQTLGEYLLQPTRLYVAKLLSEIRSPEVYAAAHITGGGLIENLPRVFSRKLQVVIQTENIPTDSVMRAFVERANCGKEEAYSTWNMGVGFVIFASESKAEELLNKFSEESFDLGCLREKKSDKAVVLE